jgi:hypothetical protein
MVTDCEIEKVKPSVSLQRQVALVIKLPDARTHWLALSRDPRGSQSKRAMS